MSSPKTQEPAAAAQPDGLADRFRGVSRRLRAQTAQALAPWEVTPAQARALGVLTRHGALRLGALSGHLHIAPRSATEVVDALETRGLVERRSDPADRRATLVAPTPRGEEVAAGIRADRAAEAEEFFARLGPGDRAALARILDVLLSEADVAP